MVILNLGNVGMCFVHPFTDKLLVILIHGNIMSADMLCGFAVDKDIWIRLTGIPVIKHWIPKLRIVTHINYKSAKFH